MILVTGATGFLGSELVKQLHTQGKRIRAVKRESSQIPAPLAGLSGIEWVNADLLDYFSLESAFDDVDQVYHCAAVVSFQPSDRRSLLRTNGEGTAHVVNICLDRGVGRLLHVSSIAALGESKKGEPITEKHFWQLNARHNGYATSKYEAEMHVWRGIAEGLNAVIVNPSVIIGRDAGSKGSGKIFETVRKGLRFYTNGICGMVDVEDVARAMILLMESGIQEERFILNAENISYKEVFETTAKCSGVRAPSIKAGAFLMGIAWRAAGLLSLVTGKTFGLTKDTARSALKTSTYSSDKFLKTFPEFSFKPVRQSISEICAMPSNVQ
ncbi:NAD-dependent epimerase/dehydratase family protein [Arcticibacter sp. MXS-1]|uniref:NAD-dependent epimerase/dehydratase family protein n=1 Tax=Arcticibacter sp. MXS-1 TaxID=3341726 RepID=UPI0035A928D4